MAKHTFLISFLAAFPALAASPANNGIPLFFVANDGQTAPEVRFMAKGSGLTAYFLKDEAVFRTFGSSIRMHLEGANPKVRVEGSNPLAGQVNFFTGGQQNWHAGLPMYGAVAYRDLYAGIDMAYGGSGRNLKSEFLVAAGADPSQIRVRYVGAGEVRIEADGALAITVNGEILHERAPEAYQIRGGKRVAVRSRFQAGADGAFGFALGGYDRSLPLVIDPVLSYSTLLGGSGADAANALAVDSTGAAYVAGFTASYDLPTLSPVQAANGGGNDVFVAKLNSTGNALVYCTYLGGTGDDRAFGIAVDSTGAAYVTGWTQSANFPVRNALQASLGGGQNAFIAKLTPTGNGLAYSTFLGGKGSDSGNGIALDSSLNAYIVGDTTSTNFPVTASGFQKTYHGGQDAFAAKLSSSGATLLYSTYIGGGNLDHGAAIAVDASGTAYITGSTSSTDFPMASAFQGINGGGQNAFITRLNAAGTSLVFSTFLGGSGGRTGYPEAGQGIALDSTGNAYIAGVTSSANFPLMNPAQSTLNGSTDAFVAKMGATGALAYSTYLGGSGLDSANAIAVDSSGNAYIGGYTYSIDLPVVSPIQPAIGSVGSTDAFVGKLSPAGNSVSFLTYLGGNDSDTATGIAIDSSGSVYVAGWTLSANFPVLNAYQTSNAGNYGAFVTKYVFNVGPVNVSVTPNSGGGTTQAFSFQYSDANGAPDLTAVGALFNTSSSLTGACAVIYNRTQNTLALLTDTAAQPATSLTPGSGTQQNSQCVLSGGGSSVSLSGNLLTLNLAIAFQGGFAGAKNIYMQAANPFQITVWQAEGTWGVLPAIAMTVTPASGNATQQTFNFQVSDSLGATDLASIGALFNTSASTTGACSVTYTRAQNTLALLTDAGALPAGSLTPGSGTQQNSQCVLNGAGSSVSAAGNLLTLNLALSFQPAFGGTKNVYMDAVSNYGTLNWTQEGTWTSPPVVTMAVSPSSGNAIQQTFSVQVSDSTGAADLTTAGVLFNATASTVAGCAINYNQAQNTLVLLTDAGGQPAASIAPGGGTQQNSQCVLNGAGSSVALSGNVLTLNLGIAFQPAFSGAKNVYVQAANPYETVNLQLEGTWIAPPVVTLAVTPASGAGASQKFTFQATDSLAATDLTTVGVLFNSTTSTTSACAVVYNRALNTLALLTDGGAQPASMIAPGSGTGQNSQCVLSGSGSSVSLSGNTLTLNLTLTFQPAFAGTKNVYMDAANPFETVNFQLEGTWITASAPGLSVTPSSGNASQQTFSLQVSDPVGTADLVTVGLLFNSTVSTTAGCAVTYNRAQNALSLQTDAGAAPASSITPGSGTQQNSQCVLNGAGSSVASAGNVLTLNLAIAFQPAFGGAKNVYSEAIATVQSVSWQQEGTWISPPVVTMAVTPASGAGTQQTFSFQATDSLAATDLTTVGVLFNSTTSTTSACAVIYNRALNTLALLTDGGAQPASSIAPGSGTQQNSQCVLSGSGSSVSAAGNTLTLNLQISFLPAFTGTKNIYMDAANPYETVNWQVEGTWVVASAIAVSVTPSAGTGTQQTFNLQVSDPLGAADLTTVGLLFNSSVSTTGACAVLYSRAQNTLTLLTDTGAPPTGSLTPGSGTQQNSQCILSGSGSSVAVAGNVVSLSLAIVFQPVFSGTRALYAEAIGIAQTVNWQQEGTWTSAPGVTLAVTPSAGAGTSQIFSFQTTDSLAATDLTTVGVLFNSTTSTASACAVIYNRAQNTLALLTDAGAQPASSITPGSGIAQNSQCVLSGSGSSVASVGNTLTLNLTFTFQPAFAGAQNVYMDAANPLETVNFQLEGTWTTGAALAMSVTPSSGNGTQQTFGLQVSDPVGASDLTTVGLLFNSTASTSGACAVTYNQAQNTLTLLTDAGVALASFITPGSGTLQNSQCVLNGAFSSASVAGNVLTLNLAIAFQPAFSGVKNVYSEAIGASQSVSWQQEGTWISPPVVAMAVMPSSGSGLQQRFSFQVTDSLSAGDLTSVGVLFNTAAAASGACAVIYNSAQSTLALLTDAGAQPAGSIAPGSGSQQNSQCVLSGSGSSVSVFGNTLTLSLTLTFLPAFTGTKNVYMDAANLYEAVNWQAEGSWVAAAALSISVTPSSGNATQQTFNLAVSDPQGAADLTTVGLLFNSSVSTTGACAVLYNRAQNTLALLTDAGTQPAGSLSPGGGTQQNSQCVLNGSGSNVAVSGSVLVLNLAVSFQPGFSGTKSVYAEAVAASQTLSWQQEGIWTSPPVVTMAVTPSSGGGPQQKFVLQVTDSLAGTDIATVGVLIGSTATTTAGACAVMYNSAQNSLALLTDAGAQPASSIGPGSGSQQNSQCVLNGGGSSVSANGNTLTLSLALTFQPAFIGPKNIYMDAANPYETVNWQAEGTWVAAPAPAISVTPSSGIATQQTFSLQVSDALGATDLSTVGILFNSTTSTAGACAVTYNRAQNALMLLTDAGAQPASAIAPGSGAQQNSQCALNGAGSSVSASGNTLTLNLAIGFQPAFSGTKNLYTEAISTYQTVNWQQQGTWASPPVVTMAVTPSSGGGAQQRFSFQVTDSLAAGDLSTIGVLFNSTASATGACAVIYNSAQNTLVLLTDAGAQPGSSIAPGSGSQQNSQCVLTGSGSSVSQSGNTLTLNLTFTFQAAFTGVKNVYMDAANPYETVSWLLEGTWATVPVITGSVTPASGSGPQQTFSFQFSDSAGTADLTTAGALINATAATTGACAVIYNRSQNTLMLLTDSGGQPAGSITPGSGTQQNSQCILTGAGSAASVSGNTLTLNLSLSFQTAFDGVKNIYVDTADPSSTIAWQLVGSWAATPVGPSVVSVTPASGSGYQQTFSLRYSDSAGAADLSTVWVFITQNFGSTSANSCVLYYAKAVNQLFLLNDAGTIWSSSAAPGAAIALSNKQCSVNVAAASATASGTDLNMNLPVTFTSAYAGNKGVYMYASSAGGAVSGWQQEGSWSVPQPAPPTLTAGPVTPASGSGTQQAFSFQFSDSNGGSDLTSVGALFNATSSMPGGCAVIYNRAQNALVLYTDAGAQPASSITPGSGTQQNSQCTLSGAGSSATISGNVLTLNLSLSFQAAFVGTKNVYMEAASSSVTLAWQAEGAWTVPKVVSGPAVASVTPAAGSGVQQTFALHYTDSAGVADLSTVWVWITSNNFSAASSPNACLLYYAKAANQLFLLNDAGTTWSSPVAPGTAITLTNSQCSVNVGGASVTASGTD